MQHDEHCEASSARPDDGVASTASTAQTPAMHPEIRDRNP